jgi:uncharacterized protein (DUF2141 family)
MKFIITLLVATALFVSNKINGQKKINITATVVNVASSNGKIGFALYNKETFMKTPIQGVKGKITNGKSTVVFKNVDPGVYAVVCYHDKNSNDKMDFTAQGLPQEDYGASNNHMTFAPPTFDNAKFLVADKNVSLDIKF